MFMVILLSPLHLHKNAFLSVMGIFHWCCHYLYVSEEMRNISLQSMLSTLRCHWICSKWMLLQLPFFPVQMLCCVYTAQETALVAFFCFKNERADIESVWYQCYTLVVSDRRGRILLLPKHLCTKPCTAQRSPKAIKGISPWAGLAKHVIAQDEASRLGCLGDRGSTSKGLHCTDEVFTAIQPVDSMRIWGFVVF